MEHTGQELQSTSNLLPNFFSLPNNDLKKKLKTGITLKEYKEAASLLNYSFEIGERKRKSQRNKKKIKKSKKSQTKGEKEEKKEKKRRRTNKKKSSQKKKNSILVGSTKKNHNSPRRKRSRKNKNTKKPITKKSLNTPIDQINSTKMDYFKLNLSKDNKPRSILKQKQKPPVESTETKQEKSNFFNFGKKVKGGPIKNIESFGKRKKKTESQTQKKKYHFGVPKNEKEIPKIRENENENVNKNKKENENEILNKNFNNKQKNLKSEIKKKEIPTKTQPKKGSLEKGSQNEKTLQPTFEANSRSYSRKNKIVFDPIMPIKKKNNPFTIKNSRRRKKRRNKQKRSLFNIQNITYNNDFFGSKADSVLNTNPFISMSHQKKIEIDLTKPHKFSSKFD
ncbi:hypothetical protein M0813_27887 [Anaeramoeba flamelloides]|uniref:Uncharacterized protein n=1 Tax=Anaeramoeba flamelloides TaxID=1746091 RepID=A0ABQ8XV69_9EUKA|nr:hypothetical protein M0813_27887 [Anaeramoeba flamelloides]